MIKKTYGDLTTIRSENRPLKVCLYVLFARSDKWLAGTIHNVQLVIEHEDDSILYVFSGGVEHVFDLKVVSYQVLKES